MHQDTYGFMWFGTYDGLNLYDGQKNTVFRYEMNNPSSLSGNIIHNIKGLGKDYLWIGTQVALNKFSIKERKVVEVHPAYRRTVLLAVDSVGDTWMLGKDNYIAYYDSIQKKFIDIPYPKNIREDVVSFFTDQNGRLCVVKKNGVIQFLSLDPHKAKRTLIIHERKFHDKTINQVFYEDHLVFFIDEDHNLFHYDNLKKQKMLLRNVSDVITQYGKIASLVFFKQEIFVGLMHGGLVKFNVSNYGKPEPVNLTIGIFGLLKDRSQDAIWIGTDGQGVSLYYEEKDHFMNIPLDNLPFTARRPIRTFYTDEENTLWIGTKGDGIIRIKDYAQYGNRKVPADKIQRFITNVGRYDNPVYCFKRSTYNTNDLWIGTEDGLSYYSYANNKMYTLEDPLKDKGDLSNTHTLCEINDSTLWVSSIELYELVIDKKTTPYRVKSKKIHRFKKDNVTIPNEYYSIIYDGYSKIFLGSRRGYGVLHVDTRTGEYGFISMESAENKGLGDIICIDLNKDSVLYVGASSGFTQIEMFKDRANRIRQFGRNDGIINDMIHGILEDKKGIVWLSTNKGLVKYNPNNGSFFNVKSSQLGVVEYSDGAYWRCPFTDRLFFGGVNGLVWVEPQDEVEDLSFEPELLFTELNVFGKEQILYDYNHNSGRILELEANQNTFQISFAMLDYIHGESYDFSYMLMNYDNNWVSLQKENKISFTKLPPGKYILKVRYKNDVLSADDNVYFLPITILPPWYQSPLAYTIYTILLLVGIGVIIYYERKRVQKKQVLIAKKVKDEQKEKMYESKLRFFTNITHELYTPLTLINGALEQIKKEDGNDRIKKYTRVMQTNVLSLNELIQEVLDYRKIEESEIEPHMLKNIDVTSILTNLTSSFSEIANQNKIDFDIEIPETLYWYTDRASFKKIVTNLLSNAFKYTPLNGRVKIHVDDDDDDFLKIVVYNTGQGMSADEIKTIFSRYRILENTNVNANNQMTARNGLGLYICYSMTKLLQGKIDVSSVVGEFVQFTVILPNLMNEELSIQTDEKVDIIEKPLVQLPLQKEPEVMVENVTNFEPLSNVILVIDDNKEIVDMVEDILSPEYTVLKTYSAMEALKLLKTQTPALIITDIMMPEIDGLSFVQMIRKDKYIKHIPIIALSAKVEDHDQIKGFEVGVDAYVTKPFSSEILLSMIARFLQNKENIKNYYDTAESAFEYTQGILMHQTDKEFIEQLTSIIRDNISNTELGAEFIALEMKIPSRKLYRQLKKILSISPTEFIKDFKLTYASKLLLSTDLSVKEVIYKIGITNKSYFYREFLKKYNMSPKQYKETLQKEAGSDTDDPPVT